jgi:hypothetical protein
MTVIESSSYSGVRLKNPTRGGAAKKEDALKKVIESVLGAGAMLAAMTTSVRVFHNEARVCARRMNSYLL